MAIALNHDTAADGTFSPDGATHWNAAHAWSGLGTNQLLFSTGATALAQSANLTFTEAKLQFGSSASAGATEFRVDCNGGAAPTVSWYVAGTKWGSIFASASNLLCRPEQGNFVVAPVGTTALVVSTTAVTVASGLDLIVGNAFVGTPQVATGYIVIKDNTGTAYKVSCNL